MQNHGAWLPLMPAANQMPHSDPNYHENLRVSAHLCKRVAESSRPGHHFCHWQCPGLESSNTSHAL